MCVWKRERVGFIDKHTSMRERERERDKEGGRETGKERDRKR